MSAVRIDHAVPGRAPTEHAGLTRRVAPRPPALRVLITGAAGQLGRELIRRAPPGVEVIGRTRRELDITSRRAVEKTCAAIGPDLIVNTAGCNGPDRAERDPDTAYAVNADGAANLARVASQGSRLIHVSSADVFGGEPHRPHEPDDAPLPGGVLGASKSEGESLALGIAHQRALVVRTAWLYSAHGSNCLTGILRRLRGPGPVLLPDDRFLTPTWAGGLAEAIWTMAFRPTLYGIHHWTDRGHASWYEFARAVRDEALAAGLLTGHGRAADLRPTAAGGQRVACPLDSARTWETLGHRAWHWRGALRLMISEIPEVPCGHA